MKQPTQHSRLMQILIKVILIILVALFIFFLDMSHAEAKECPEDGICLTAEEKTELWEAVSLHNCMVEEAENSQIDFSLEPNQITITKNGQVFVNDEIKGRLQWCSWDLEIQGKTDALVHETKEEEDWGFELRIKLGITWLPTTLGKGPTEVTRMFDPVLLFEPFHVWQFHPEIYAGFKTFGLVAGMDVTKNLDLFAGAGLEYKDADVVPVLGLALSFN